MSDFMIVGNTSRGQLHDLHRDGIISEITEHTEFISTNLCVDLGPLHGTTCQRKSNHLNARNAFARAHARSALFGPHAQEPCVREATDNSDIASAAFPALEDVPSPDNAEVDVDDLPKPVLDENLFADDNANVDPSLDVLDVGGFDRDDPVDDWVQCDRCHVWRHPPPGTFHTFTNSEATFSCSVVGATCCNLKRRI